MGVARVGQALGLVPRQVRLAARAGLLDQHEDGTFDADCVARAAADQRWFSLQQGGGSPRYGEAGFGGR